MDFRHFLDKQTQIINKRVEQTFVRKLKNIEKTEPKLGELYKEFIKVSGGGKGLRGGLVVLGYQIAGGKKLNEILDAAVAAEIFQTAILAQDDVIDKSILRRGKQSLYQALGGDHKAISEAICLSDLGFFHCFDLFLELKVDDLAKLKAIKLFSETVSQTLLGVLLDIEASSDWENFSEDKVLKISYLKTARYTVSGPLMLGVVLAGGNQALLDRMRKFGDNLGIAFQIQDDILGIFGKEELTGKSNSDINEGKATILTSYVLGRANKKNIETLKKYYGKDVKERGIKEVFTQSGALEYAKSKMRDYADLAGQDIKSMKIDEDDKSMLTSLVKYLINYQ